MSPVASTRWCPTAEQIMILEEMYRGGIRTPNATQIQQITAHLSLYGKIEGKNVFYWFQNHKARDRQKLRKRLLGKQLHLQQPHQHLKHIPNLHAPLPTNHFISNDHTNNFHNFLHQLHFDETLPPPPPPPPSLSPPSSLLAFHHLHNTFNSPPANQQGRPTHTYMRKVETILEGNNGREKPRPMRITHDDDWIIVGDHHDDDDDDDDDNHDDHEMEGATNTNTRPLKTLQLFPIKEKTSLKEQQTHFQAYF